MTVTPTYLTSLDYGEALPGFFQCAGTGATGTGIALAAAITAADSELGVDIACLTDITSNLILSGGRINLANALGRRLTTPNRFLFEVTRDLEAAEYGFDIVAVLNQALSDDDVTAIGDQIRAQVQAEPRVVDVDVSVTFDFPTSTLTANINVEDAQGPFPLVLKVSDLTVQILDGSGGVLFSNAI